MEYINLSENARSHLAAQLWKYYDIEVDEILEMVTAYNDGTCRVFYEAENGVTDTYVRMKVYRDRIEDLYLVGSDGKSIEPTTTQE